MIDLDLNNKIALITGGTRGLGRAIAEKLAEQKVKIVVTGTNKERAEEAASEISSAYNVETLGLQQDVSSEESTKEVVKCIINKFKRIDILVNNAGITSDGIMMMMKKENWDKVININLTGAFNSTKFVSKHMLKQKSGTIVNITSVVGITGNAGQANYSASKAGLIGFTKTVARELADRGITVNAIAPGYISTDMTSKLPDKVSREILSQIPMKAYGSPEAVANAVLFLASNMSNYITGQVINVDGGMVMY
ncbi:3-oxoacyl-[acyl-carrier-protein] reductase FabG [Clostridium pasteurianum DSM 525 = ATCC 6013]|uniref:3-oxoacyl-[acyl-carrier-protein] reductase n=1 Tax=Clostridium pasteurianum DSM 525 = ATCC 6013 TaxID=1262449 RepID=A0A0H3J4Z8_CLOPA|nr:3-oxoacyl-[acyl-carrier-protein] reductase [Clostridium pasteurianum]AJA47033.1 3-oxoacyl-[acyl-carrier-protein] reductase FabG [Clostridium pasteurianum DSM 525 = ATCC 6013]AJA51021.1 3-oxoacyl-[acyl-carrier-protein] reductase FabG [Clostridium pasteurianum DSM 525 = ATCC 6013]AOZ74404.1 3-oxoacyl-ACP synthase [Clostridium pasteurianum DSM 525 = ATCC 6013]AOZ78201.1 3-oxoacyl-ACP synthase [Clostridium pasteurianum]ELP57492.1 3-oxoacyl-ACP reductase [Clostridium pasteurianum DSM 525 = ATCC 